MNQILEDVAADVLSSLIKASARAGVDFIRSALSDQETSAAPVPPRRAAGDPDSFHALFGAVEEVDDPFAAPAAYAEDFVERLAQGDHDRACGLCEPGLFGDAERRAVLLETLSAARPRRWRCQLYRHPVDWHAGEPLPWVGVDYDVVFKVDTGARTMTLIVWVVPSGHGWAVWSLEWGARREA